MSTELTLNDLPQPDYQGVLDIDQLHTDGDNPNEMPSDLFETLKDRMLERGWIGGPILTDTDGLIADGQHRWEAAQEIGLVEVEVKQYDVDDAGRRLLRQEANKIRGEHDDDTDQAEFEEIIKGGRKSKLSELLVSLDDKHDDVLGDIGSAGGDSVDDMAGIPAEETALELEPDFEVIVECGTEADQQQAYEDISEQGYTCRISSM